MLDIKVYRNVFTIDKKLDETGNHASIMSSIPNFIDQTHEEDEIFRYHKYPIKKTTSKFLMTLNNPDNNRKIRGRLYANNKIPKPINPNMLPIFNPSISHNPPKVIVNNTSNITNISCINGNPSNSSHTNNNSTMAFDLHDNEGISVLKKPYQLDSHNNSSNEVMMLDKAKDNEMVCLNTSDIIMPKKEKFNRNKKYVSNEGYISPNKKMSQETMLSNVHDIKLNHFKDSGNIEPSDDTINNDNKKNELGTAISGKYLLNSNLMLTKPQVITPNIRKRKIELPQISIMPNIDLRKKDLSLHESPKRIFKLPAFFEKKIIQRANLLAKINPLYNAESTNNNDNNVTLPNHKDIIKNKLINRFHLQPQKVNPSLGIKVIQLQKRPPDPGHPSSTIINTNLAHNNNNSNHNHNYNPNHNHNNPDNKLKEPEKIMLIPWHRKPYGVQIGSRDIFLDNLSPMYNEKISLSQKASNYIKHKQAASRKLSYKEHNIHSLKSISPGPDITYNFKKSVTEEKKMTNESDQIDIYSTNYLNLTDDTCTNNIKPRELSFTEVDGFLLEKYSENNSNKNSHLMIDDSSGYELHLTDINDDHITNFEDRMDTILKKYFLDDATDGIKGIDWADDTGSNANDSLMNNEHKELNGNKTLNYNGYYIKKIDPEKKKVKKGKNNN